MLSLTHRLLSLATGLALLAVPAAAQSIDTHTPTAGATGTLITISGEGFLPSGKGKPKVYLTQEGSKKKLSLKVVSASDTEIVAELKQGKANKSGDDDYDLKVVPAVKKAAELTSPEGFRVAGPELLVEGALEGDPDEQITVFAQFLGNKKPSVKVGKSGAKVVDFVADIGDPGDAPVGSFTFVMPKKLANGTYDLSVKTGYGTSTFSSQVQVVNSTVGVPGGSKPSFKAKLDGKTFTQPKQDPLGYGGGGGTTSFAINSTGNPSKSMLVTLLYNAGSDGAATLTLGNGVISAILGITKVGPGLNIDTSNYNASAFTFDIAANDSGVLKGTCSATFQRTSGTGPLTVQMTDGEFVLPSLAP